MDVDPMLISLAEKVKLENARLLEAEKQDAENKRRHEENERKQNADADHQRKIREHQIMFRDASVSLQQCEAKLKVSPFTKTDLEIWKSVSQNDKSDPQLRLDAQGLLAAHAALILEIQRLTKNLKDIEKNKPLSQEEKSSREKVASVAQQKEACEADEEAVQARVDKFNASFEKFQLSQKKPGKVNPMFNFRKACVDAMSPRGTSFLKLCSHGIDPAIFPRISAISGDTLKPLFCEISSSITLVHNWKSLFPMYNQSKASKDGMTLSQEEYYNRCVMVAAFRFWQNGNRILLLLNQKPRDKPLMMYQLLSNAANFSDMFDFKTRQDFVSQQATLFREQKEREKLEADASAKPSSSGSSNTFALLEPDVPCARGGGSEVVSCMRAGSSSNGVCTQLKTRGGSCKVPQSTEERPLQVGPERPTAEQSDELRKLLTIIGQTRGGIDQSHVAFNNNDVTWCDGRGRIMEILTVLKVKVLDKDAVFKYLKDFGFTGEVIDVKKGSGKGMKQVISILDKDGSVVQKVDNQTSKKVNVELPVLDFEHLPASAAVAKD